MKVTMDSVWSTDSSLHHVVDPLPQSSGASGTGNPTTGGGSRIPAIVNSATQKVTDVQSSLKPLHCTFGYNKIQKTAFKG